MQTYDTQAKRDRSNATVPVTVTLGSAHTMSIYQPYTQAAAMSSVASSTSVAVNVPDHPLVIEINP